jgi:AraC-like DNA-binding protein
MSQPPQERRPEGFPGERLVVIPPAITRRASRQPVTRDLCVTHIGAFLAAKGHYVERARGTAQHILIACMSGRGSCVLNGHERTIGPGDVLFLPPRKRHLYQAAAAFPWTILWAHFQGRRADDYVKSLNVSSSRPVIAVDDPGVLAEAFEDAFRHTIHGFSDSAMVALSTAFARMLGLAGVKRRAAGVRIRESEARLFKVLALMRDNLARSWTLEELAAEAALSIPHFTELCRRQTGMPPLSLLIRLRLQRAMDLLQQGNHSVTGAARAVGYDDPFYFSRLFRKHMGVTPKSCRSGP